MFGFEHHMFNGLHDGWLWGMHLAGWLVWALLVGGVIWAVTRTQKRSPVPASPQKETPLQTLQRRYAEGEISTSEYEERKNRIDRDR